MTPNKFEQSDSTPRSPLAGQYRYILMAALAGAAISITGCEGDEVQPEAPASGIACVTVTTQDPLGQEDKPMEGCKLEYKIPQSILDEDAAYFIKWGSGQTPTDPCNEGSGGGGGTGGTGGANEGGTAGSGGASGETEKAPDRIFVYGRTGTKKITVKCNNEYDKVVGLLKVPIFKGETNDHFSRPINSFGTNGYKFVADSENQTIALDDQLCWNDETWCPNKLSQSELGKTEIVDFVLDCTNLQNCDPIDGRKFLTAHGEPGEFSEGKPKHLTLTANTALVPAGETRTVLVILKQTNGPTQQLAVPIEISGSACKNGVIEAGEECEGTDFGGKSCAQLGFDGGDLNCTDNCQISTSECVG